MALPSCTLSIDSNCMHLQQVYTGFSMLKKQNKINLNYRLNKTGSAHPNVSKNLLDKRRYHVSAVLNDKTKVYYDVHDGQEFDEESYNDSDFYFKRSYDVKKHKRLEKMKPLGFNYLVLPSYNDYDSVKRLGITKNRSETVLELQRAFRYLDWFHFVPRTSNTYSPPQFALPSKILFMTRAWDPYDNPNRPDTKVQQRVEMNETRANCIRALKKEFGNSFFGGFQKDDFTNKNYRDVLLPDANSSSKSNYFKFLKSFPICIATTGLHDSIGWKLGEYVAFSKAIISEKLYNQVPGDFTIDRNYLEFNSVDECLEKSIYLFESTKERNEMMSQNFDYYNKYLRPDVMIQNTLDQVL